jgi:hypothetical protein
MNTGEQLIIGVNGGIDRGYTGNDIALKNYLNHVSPPVEKVLAELEESSG